MADNSKIEWTDATWNAVTGCTKVSAGCDNCYAETFAERWRGTPGHYFERGFDVQLRPDKLDQPLRWRRPRRVFVNSMSDLFHDDVPDSYIGSVFDMMARTPQHTYQILTKRHGRMRSLLNRWADNDWMWRRHDGMWCGPVNGPLPNVWGGVSVEDQKWAGIRIPALLDTPLAVRFLSCEPLLGAVQLAPGWLTQLRSVRTGIDWVIVGGESGPRARPMHPDWARALRDQCTAAGTPFFFKQWGEWGPAPWRVDREPGETDDAYKARAEAICATHSLPVWADQYDMAPKQAGHRPWSLERRNLPNGDPQAALRRWGKKAAGRELDGRTWDEFPEVARAQA